MKRNNKTIKIIYGFLLVICLIINFGVYIKIKSFDNDIEACLGFILAITEILIILLLIEIIPEKQWKKTKKEGVN